MISVLCAIMAGVTIVLSRSVNSYLSQKIGAYQSTFFNYFTGLIMSIIVLLIVGFKISSLDMSIVYQYPTVFIGGIIGVFNILILNLIVSKISPVKLTLMTFVAQLITGMILDYLIYHMFSINKFIGCIIVVIGLIMYQMADIKIKESITEIKL